MTSEPSSGELETRIERLAGEGAWPEIHDTLGSLDQARILASSRLAYRFAEALYHTGRMRELAGFADRYEVAARAASDLRGTLRALNLRGIAAFELGDIEGARSRWERQLELSDGAGESEMLARAANNLGAVANLRGDHRQAVAYYRLALPVYQKRGQLRGLAQTHHNLGVSHRDLGELDEALADFERARQLAERLSYPPLVAMALVSRGELALDRADPALAERLAGRASDIARGVPDPIGEGDALRVRGAARVRLGRVDEGLDDLATALDLARETGNALLEAETLRDLGMRLRELGRPEGIARLREAVARFEALGAERERDRLTALLGDAP